MPSIKGNLTNGVHCPLTAFSPVRYLNNSLIDWTCG